MKRQHGKEHKICNQSLMLFQSMRMKLNKLTLPSHLDQLSLRTQIFNLHKRSMQTLLLFRANSKMLKILCKRLMKCYKAVNRAKTQSQNQKKACIFLAKNKKAIRKYTKMAQKLIYPKIVKSMKMTIQWTFLSKQKRYRLKSLKLQKNVK